MPAASTGSSLVVEPRENIAMGFTMGMRLALAVAVSAVTGNAQAETLLGRLELASTGPLDAAMVVRLVTDGGRRYQLDGKQALRAAADLRALPGRRVAVEFSDLDKSLPTTMRKIEAIVPVDDLVSPPRALVASVAPKLLGNTPWLTIACKFSDVPAEPRNIRYFNEQYVALDEYWRQTSYNRINLQGSYAVGWFVLPHPRSYYVSVDYEGYEIPRLELLTEDCLGVAGAQASLAGMTGVNFMVNAEFAREAPAAHGYTWRCFRQDADSFCANPVATLSTPSVFEDLNRLAHVMGHGYGLQDNGRQGGGYGNVWSLMGVDLQSGNWPSDPEFGSYPKHLAMHERKKLGFVDPARYLDVDLPDAAQLYTLDRADLASSANLQMIRVGDIVIEARKRFAGSYDNALPGDSVVIHKQIDFEDPSVMTVVDCDTSNGDVHGDEDFMLKVGESCTRSDGSIRVKVVAETAQGFVVAIGPSSAFRSTGGNQMPRSRAPSSSPAANRVATRRSVARRPEACEGLPGQGARQCGRGDAVR